MDEMADTIDVRSGTGPDGRVESVEVRFGTHYVVEVRTDVDKIVFALTYTHHGFTADASQVGGELETIIEEVRRAHPQISFD
jgi:hypothetical protein